MNITVFGECQQKVESGLKWEQKLIEELTVAEGRKKKL